MDETCLFLIIVLLVFMIPASYLLGAESMRGKVLPWYGPAKSSIPSVTGAYSLPNATVYPKSAYDV